MESGHRKTRPEYQSETDPEEFWAVITPKREPMQKRWFVPAVVFFMVMSIPWYLPQGYVGRVIGGLPIWVWVALVCAACISLISSYMAFFRWDDDEFDWDSKE